MELSNPPGAESTRTESEYCDAPVALRQPVYNPPQIQAAPTRQAAPAVPLTTWSKVTSGIEAGIVGGLAMLALLLSQSLLDGHVWWEVPNLLGSTFYGPRAFRAGTGMATLSGLALHFVITGTLGGVFGLAFGGIRQRGRLLLLGLVASFGWYTLANSAFWPAVNPWVPAASPRPGTVVSHVLLGACLGFIGQRQRAGSHVQPEDRLSNASSTGLGVYDGSASDVSPVAMPLLNVELAAAAELAAAPPDAPVATAFEAEPVSAPVAADQTPAPERGQPSAAGPSDALE